MSVLFLPFLNIINKKYRKGDYQRILRVYSTLHTNKDKYNAYINTHRVCALIQTQNPAWVNEYKYIMENGQLDVLGEEDKKYIMLYFFLITQGRIMAVHTFKTFDLSKITKRTRKYFPWKIEDMQIALKKFPDEKWGVAAIEFFHCQRKTLGQ